jgi:hypothetical protein
MLCVVISSSYLSVRAPLDLHEHACDSSRHVGRGCEPAQHASGAVLERHDGVAGAREEHQPLPHRSVGPEQLESRIALPDLVSRQAQVQNDHVRDPGQHARATARPDASVVGRARSTADEHVVRGVVE